MRTEAKIRFGPKIALLESAARDGWRHDIGTGIGWQRTEQRFERRCSCFERRTGIECRSGDACRVEWRLAAQPGIAAKSRRSARAPGAGHCRVRLGHLLKQPG